MRILVGIALLLASHLGWAKWHGDAQDIMGTKVSVALWLEDDQKAEQAVAAVMAEMRRIDQHFSPYIETSELYRVNQLAPKASAKNPLVISAELAAIINAQSLYHGVPAHFVDPDDANVVGVHPKYLSSIR